MAESYLGWSRRDTCGASSSGQGDKNETWRGAKDYTKEERKEMRDERRLE